jgi:hypothetical protein
MSASIHLFAYGQIVYVTLGTHSWRAIVVSRWRLGQSVIRVRLLGSAHRMFADVRSVSHV